MSSSKPTRTETRKQTTTIRIQRREYKTYKRSVEVIVVARRVLDVDVKDENKVNKKRKRDLFGSFMTYLC